MFKKTILVIILFLSVFLLFCEKDKHAVSPGEDMGINGTVTNVNGIPLEDVGVHLVFLDYPFSPSITLSKIYESNSIALSYFRVTSSMQTVILYWATLSESGNLGFKILRSNQQFAGYSLIASYENNWALKGHTYGDTLYYYYYSDTTVSGGNQYWYKLVDVDTNGIETEHGPVATSIIYPVVPSEYRLYQNYPNPFNPTTTIQFETPQGGKVRLNILDWKNRDIIFTMFDDNLHAGYHSFGWNGKNKYGEFVTNNLYIFRMDADGFSDEKVMCLQMLDPEHIKSLNAVPLVKTNRSGKFLLKFSSIPLGQSFIHTSEVGEKLGTISVSQNMKIVLIKDGYKNFVEEMKIDGNSQINKTFRLTPN